MMKTNLKTETFTCPSCIKKIEGTLNRSDGVDTAKVLFNSSKVKVEHDENKISPDEIRGLIEKLGYEVESVKSS
ncbi:heavy metal-binding protein [Salinicoccus roseus]|uniref:Heavy metal-binding protein n=2 Tax=Salinicoccus roseus TaxID=45670 RepID=A0A0C2DLD2_9STAP|nr:heavy metal-binding protein [Salinicoccus roseus]